MIDLQSLFWLTVTCLITGFWWRTYQARERALQAVKQRCRLLDLQFLDQSVALNQMKLRRSKSGRLQLWRSYRFEFSSTGEERYPGEVIIAGNKVERIDLEAHRLPEDGERRLH